MKKYFIFMLFIAGISTSYAQTTITINTIEGDDYVNATEVSSIEISGTSTNIPNDGQIRLSFSGLDISSMNVIVTNNAWSYTIPSGQISIVGEGAITVTASYSGATDVTRTFTVDTIAPALASAIDYQTATVGTDFSFTIPDGTFSDLNTPTYTSSGEGNGISFATDTWSGVGSSLTAGTVTVTVTATDAAGNTATDEFDIVISEVIVRTAPMELIKILAALVVAVLLAIAIVKYLPLKYRWLASLVLVTLAAVLVYKIYDGIMRPINFDIEKKERFAKVIKNLKIIRDAEVAHYEVTGNYTANKARLISFIDTARRAIVETRDTVIEVNKGTKWQKIMVPVEKRIKDTIGYEPILDDFSDRDYKKMFSVPGLKGKEFEIAISRVEKVAGLQVPVFEAKTDKESILKGMDRSLVKQEKEAITTDEIKGEFISVGSLSEVTTGGNWPPFYDKEDATKKKNN